MHLKEQWVYLSNFILRLDLLVFSQSHTHTKIARYVTLGQALDRPVNSAESNASTPYHSNMTSISWGHKMYELSIGIHMKCSWCSKLTLRMTKHRLGEQRGSWVRVKVRHATKCPWKRNSHLSSIFFSVHEKAAIWELHSILISLAQHIHYLNLFRQTK